MRNGAFTREGSGHRGAGRPCSICSHPRRTEIGVLLARDVPLRAIAAQFKGITKSSLDRHRNVCIPRLVEIEFQKDGENSRMVKVILEELMKTLDYLLDAKDKNGYPDHDARLRAVSLGFRLTAGIYG